MTRHEMIQKTMQDLNVSEWHARLIVEEWLAHFSGNVANIVDWQAKLTTNVNEIEVAYKEMTPVRKYKRFQFATAGTAPKATQTMVAGVGICTAERFYSEDYGYYYLLEHNGVLLRGEYRDTAWAAMKVAKRDMKRLWREQKSK